MLADDCLSEADAAGRPVDGEHGADQILAWNGSPPARIAGGRTVVAEHQVLARRDRLLGDRLRVPAIRLDVGLDLPLAVQVDVTVLLAPAISREGDQPFDERLPLAAVACERRGR